jgi:hypothetical protein
LTKRLYIIDEAIGKGYLIFLVRNLMLLLVASRNILAVYLLAGLVEKVVLAALGTLTQWH